MDEPVVFFGTGPVAAKSLQLLAQWARIEAVITKPRPEHHKGDFPVLSTAEKLGLPVHTVTNKKDLDSLVAQNTLSSKLGVLIDFGIIVSQQVIDYFPLGIVNSHFSLLPEWRGADPITFSILSGQAQTGVSLMLLTAGMDEGPLLSNSQPVRIEAGETTISLTEKLIAESDASLQAVLPLYIAGTAQPIDQFAIAEQVMGYPSEATYSRKLTKDDGQLDFNKPAAQLEREIRAFIEWPKSRTQLGGKDVVITQAHSVPSQSPDAKPGDVEFIKAGGVIMIATSDGSLCIDKLKPAGKGEMTAAAFLNGYQL